MKKIILILLLNLSSFAGEIKSITLSTIHGSTIVGDPLLIELIESPLMQRLHHIHQYGVDEYLRPQRPYAYTRYDHSIGVYQLVHQHGGSRQEQVAALLHDASHTVFSHTLDMLFVGRMDGEAYQDLNHEKFLIEFGVGDILKKYGLTVQEILPDQAHFRRLEQSSPDLCADRIEYIIHHGDLEDTLTRQEISQIHQHLHFKEENWYFDDVELAEKYARISLSGTRTSWGAPHNFFNAKLISKAIKILWIEGKISSEDVHFSLTDRDMWELLSKSDHPEVQKLMEYAKNLEDYYTLTDDFPDKDLAIKVLKTKFRGVDPLVLIEGKLRRLTSLSSSYQQDYRETKSFIEQGWRARCHEELLAAIE